MILTNCAACAAPLAHDHKKRCSRCKTRYCNEACQRQHWERGGHEALCRRIKRGGGAEQYHADKKYKEAVAEAVEACADDTKGQTCYICTQALHWKTKEGLVRMCACRGTAGFVHVSCLAEQAKILVAEGEENNLGDKVMNARWHQWDTCSMCERRYHGVVACALGWACWKTYVGRPEADYPRQLALNHLGNGLCSGKHHTDALSVQEAELAMYRRLGASEDDILATQNNIAGTYEALGQHEAVVGMRQDVYSGTSKLLGKEHGSTLLAANNYAASLINLQRFAEAKSLVRKVLPVARRVLGEDDDLMLKVWRNYAAALSNDTGATLDDLREAVTMLEEAARTARRVFGGAHPDTKGMEIALGRARAALGSREMTASGRGTTRAGDVRALREAVAAMSTTSGTK